MNKCTACENMQEAQGVCDKCGAQTEAMAPESSAPEMETPTAGDSDSKGSEDSAM